MEIDFTKMNGCGNDFVVIDARKPELQGLELTKAQVQMIAARNNPITKGCDQVLLIRPPKAGGTVFMEIRNADGGQVEACGNGTRAVAAYLADNDKRQTGDIETLGGVSIYKADLKKEKQVEGKIVPHVMYAYIEMPTPKFGWQDIPLNKETDDTARVKLHADLPPAFLVNLGNPHAVFFVTGETETFARQYGPTLEQHALFPARANINFALKEIGDITKSQRTTHSEAHSGGEATISFQQKGSLILHTWERGVGLTKSCGTGACASAIAHNHLFLKKPRVNYYALMDGGNLTIDYDMNRSPPRLEMQGWCEFEFDGKITLNDKVAI